jgi:hypothetical protein
MQVVPDTIVAFQKHLVCSVRHEYPVRIFVSMGDFAPSLYSRHANKFISLVYFSLSV